MDNKPGEIQAPKSLWDHVRTVHRRMRAERTMSFYLLLLLFGVGGFSVRCAWMTSEPWRFALCLSLSFAFLFVAIFIALLECLEAFRLHITERDKPLRETLAEPGFLAKLAARTKSAGDEPREPKDGE